MTLKDLGLGCLGFFRYLLRCVAQFKNRRIYSRINVNHLLKVTACENLSNTLCNLIDISEGGLKFIAPRKPQTGSRIQMLVNLSEESRSILLSGQVIWTKPSSRNSYHVGVQFTEPEFRGIESVRNFIEFSRIGLDTLRG